MKKILSLFMFLSLSIICEAQTGLYFQAQKIIGLTHPEINTTNRLIAVNFWSIADQESRSANQAFDKAYKVYEFAKLKGGTSGLIVISINRDNGGSQADIILKKDGITKVINGTLDDLQGIDAGNLENIIFDANGNMMYKNLPSSKIFESVNKLITR